jgi:hypothetical protein
MDPSQQVGLVDPELLARDGIPRAQVFVDAPNPGARGFGGGSRSEHDSADVVGRTHQPTPGVAAEVRVLHHARDRPGMQGLKIEGTQPGEPEHRLGVDAPAHTLRPEQAEIVVRIHLSIVTSQSVCHHCSASGEAHAHMTCCPGRIDRCGSW